MVSFFILPPIWELGRKHGLHTQSDFFKMRYGGRYLAAFVSVVGVVCLIPYVQLQLTLYRLTMAFIFFRRFRLHPGGPRPFQR